MAEDGELPPLLSRRNRAGAPWVAEVIVGAGAIALLFVGELSRVIGFSSFSVLLYYAIGHLSAWLIPEIGKAVRVVAFVGFGLCALLAVAVPGPAVWVSVLILVAALAVRWLARGLISRA
jgi:APA family basic amino acid/polyamine antiporter